MLLDIMSMSSLWRSNDTMMVGAEDVVLSLSNVLLSVGGETSPFVSQTRIRMGELLVSKGSLVRPKLVMTDGNGVEKLVEETDENAISLSDLM